MSEPRRVFTESQKRWFFVLALGILQNTVAVFAVQSSSRDVLSDGACIGGVFGTLANLLILAVVLVWSITMAVKSPKRSVLETDRLKSLLVVGVSSSLAIFIGYHAAIRCTV